MPAYSLALRGPRRPTTRVLILRKEGETIQFLSTGQETRGEMAEMIFSIPPGRTAPPAHLHLKQSEHVRVIAGAMNISIGNEQDMLYKGEEVTIPAGMVHSFGNASKKEPLVVRVCFTPASNMEWYFTQMACSAIRNGGSWKDVPLLESATIHWTLRKELRSALYPYWMQDLYFGSLTLLAKLTGAIRNIKPLSLYKAYVK